MKKYLYCLCLLFLFLCCSAVEAQEYKVTEIQLQKLEQNLTALEQNRQKALEQANESKERAKKLNEYAENLQEQLQAERIIATNLEKSLTKSEDEKASLANENFLLNEKLTKQKLKNKNLIITIVIESCILVMIILFFALSLYLKIKKSVLLF